MMFLFICFFNKGGSVPAVLHALNWEYGNVLPASIRIFNPQVWEVQCLYLYLFLRGV